MCITKSPSWEQMCGIFSPDMSLRVSIKVRICPYLLVPSDLNLFKPIQQGHSVILMSYKQLNSKSEGYIENFSVADRSDGCYSDAVRCSKYSSFAKISRGSVENREVHTYKTTTPLSMQSQTNKELFYSRFWTFSMSNFLCIFWPCNFAGFQFSYEDHQNFIYSVLGADSF